LSHVQAEALIFFIVFCIMQVIIPPGCLLNPSGEAAVVGGNVLTSQRVTDVLLKAFGACAASQGCMNNLT
jgi:5-oxoprolinase (ATP-hydrolysing)